MLLFSAATSKTKLSHAFLRESVNHLFLLIMKIVNKMMKDFKTSSLAKLTYQYNNYDESKQTVRTPSVTSRMRAAVKARPQSALTRTVEKHSEQKI